MKNWFKLFFSKTPQKTLITLFGGCLLIIACSVFVCFSVWKFFDHHERYQKIAFQILSVYHLVDASTQEVKMPTAPVYPYKAIQVSHLPSAVAQTVQPNLPNLLHWIMAHPTGGTLALPLQRKQWLNLDIRLAPEPFLFPAIGFGLLIILLLSSLLFLCYWTIQRLHQPLVNLAQTLNTINLPGHILARTDNKEVNRIITLFNQMQTHIHQLLQARTQILAAIAHDLRTPITRLKLRLEYFSDNPQYQKAMTDLTEMEEMINSALSFARQENYHASMEEFDLNALLESLSHDFSDMGMPVQYQGCEKTISFYGSLGALKRAFNNLIDNAIKYGKTASIILSHDTEFIYIQIDDQGPGIPSEQLNQVFEPFYRIEPSRSKKTGGTGLGLAIARDILSAHQGKIQLSNRNPSGLRVMISLPVNTKF